MRRLWITSFDTDTDIPMERRNERFREHKLKSRGRFPILRNNENVALAAEKKLNTAAR